jgi:predicted  nucleic acid-binding Zn-ribbon protein
VTPWWVPVAVAIIGAGLFNWMRDGFRAYRRWRQQGQPAAAAVREANDNVAIANQSVLLVSNAGVRLENDNERLRQSLRDADARYRELQDEHQTERTEWRVERTDMRAEIGALRDQLDAMEAKWQEALRDLKSVRGQLTNALDRLTGIDDKHTQEEA